MYGGELVFSEIHTERIPMIYGIYYFFFLKCNKVKCKYWEFVLSIDLKKKRNHSCSSDILRQKYVIM